MEQESIAKEMKDPRKIQTIGKVLSFKEVMKSKKKKKKSKNKDSLDNETHIKYDKKCTTKKGLKFFKYGEDGESL